MSRTMKTDTYADGPPRHHDPVEPAVSSGQRVTCDKCGGPSNTVLGCDRCGAMPAVSSEPPPARSELGEFWVAWFDAVKEHATVDVVHATTKLVIAEREIYARDHPVRADAHEVEIKLRAMLQRLLVGVWQADLRPEQLYELKHRGSLLNEAKTLAAALKGDE